MGSGQSQPNIMRSGALFSDKNNKKQWVNGAFGSPGQYFPQKIIKIVGSGGTLNYNNVFRGSFRTESVQR